MADISLRNYVNEIDTLIENGQQIDQAIEHCRHILKEFPKHVDTYRLLGKAFLEKKQYRDSADIFNRVLSAIPDDFVSHIGLAIAREDENNIDDAIWHMERAFEANPANTAIQHELRRLILKRDGLEPQKIRLTRAALSRVYAHGELYPQAAAELKAALNDDPARVDLQVLLAEIQLKSGNLERAGEISFQVLEKLPNCLIANRIAAALLLKSKEPEKAEIYFQRVKTMDPYTAFLASPLDDPAEVSPDRVTLTKGQRVSSAVTHGSGIGQSEWAASLQDEHTAENDAEAPADALPSWLESIDEEFPQQITEPEIDETPSIHPFAGAEPPEEAEIPEWMREAGWTESSGEFMEAPVHFSDEELQQLESGEIQADSTLEPADLPDWLQEVAPEGTARSVGDAIQSDAEGEVIEPSLDVPSEPMEAFVESPEVEDSEEGEPSSPSIPSWLEDATPGATETIVTWLGDKSREEARKPDQELPDWMSGTGPLDEKRASAALEALDQESHEQEVQDAVLPDAEQPLADIVEPPLDVEPPKVEQPAEPEVSEDLPDWLHTISDTSDNEQESAEELEIPDWIHSMAEQAGDSSDDAPSPIPPSVASEDPEWLESEQDQPETMEGQDLPDWLTQSTDDLPETGLEPQDSEPAWLEEDNSTAPPESPPDRKAPEWISELTEEPQDSVPIPVQIEEPSDLDWLEELVEDSPAAGIQQSDEEPPDWLSGVIGPEAAAPMDDFASPADEEIDWLQEFSDAPSQPAASQAEETASEDAWIPDLVSPTDTPEAGTMEQDLELDWLQQAVSSPPEDVSDEPTLVSDSKPVQRAGSINEQPTMPTTRQIITPGEIHGILSSTDDIEQPLPDEAFPDFSLEIEESPGTPSSVPVEEVIFTEGETDDVPSAADAVASPSLPSEEELLDPADQILAEIAANNSRSQVPDALRATEDELELLKLLDEEDEEDAEALAASDISIEPASDEPMKTMEAPAQQEQIPTGDNVPVEDVTQSDAVEETAAPDWLTELATEEGFADSLEEDDPDLISAPLSEDAFDDAFRLNTEPVEWIPEQEILAESSADAPSDRHELAEAPSDIDEPVPPTEAPGDDLHVSDEELEQALDWLETNAVQPGVEAAAREGAEYELPIQKSILQEEETTEDFFDSLAAVEQTSETPGTPDQSPQEMMPVESDSPEGLIAPSEPGEILKDDAPMEAPQSGLLSADSIRIDSEELPPLVEEYISDLPVIEAAEPAPDSEEAASEHMIDHEPDFNIEYKKTGILSNRELPESATRGFEWLSELAAYHEKPLGTSLDSVEVPEWAKEPPAQIIEREPSFSPVEPEPAASQPVEIEPEPAVPQFEDFAPEAAVAATETEPSVAQFEGMEPESVPSPFEDIEPVLSSTMENEPEPAFMSAEPEPAGPQFEDIEPEKVKPPEQRKRQVWKVTLTARKTEPPAEFQETEETTPPEEEPASSSTAEAPEPDAVVIEPETATDYHEPDWIQPAIDDITGPSADDGIPEWLKSSADPEYRSPARTAGITPVQPAASVPDGVEPVDETAAVQSSLPEPIPLDKARHALNDSDFEAALETYQQLIKKRLDLEEIIRDLRSAAEEHPASSMIWQTLGDALMQNNQTAEAIQAYQSGMDAA